MATKRFAIALSFPGNHRAFVQKVADSLGVSLGRERVFYDQWYEVELTGKNGDRKLRQIYRFDSELVVPFFSESYATRPWCGIEWDAIRNIFLERAREDSVVPVHMDGTRVDGWDDIDFGIRRRGRTAQEIANLVLQKYDQVRLTPTDTISADGAGPSPTSRRPNLDSRPQSDDGEEPPWIFVSHHNSDLTFAQSVKKTLEDHHIDGRRAFRVWLAQDTIDCGDGYREKIDEALRRSAAIVVVLSPGSSKSIYVTYEWGFAIGCRIPVIPIRRHKAKVHPRLEDLQYIDFLEGSSPPWMRLLESLSRKLSQKGEMEPNDAVIEDLRKEVVTRRNPRPAPPQATTLAPPRVASDDVLLVIDVQQDFFLGGALPVAGAETLIGPLNEAIRRALRRSVRVVFSRDWHPVRHRSFLNMSPDGTWPPHCIQETPGALFHPKLFIPPDSQIVSIGTKNSRLGYSALEDESLARILTTPRKAKTLYIAGMALEYCVQATALEAAGKYGIRVVILESLVRATTQQRAKLERLWKFLESQGIERHSGPLPFGVDTGNSRTILTNSPGASLPRKPGELRS